MDNTDQCKPISFAKGYRFQWESAQQAHVLLYPEGLVKLNQTAALILANVDGEKTLVQITEELSKQFPDDNINADIESFITHAFDNGWIVFNS